VRVIIQAAGARQFAEEVKLQANGSPSRVAAVVAHYGQVLQTRVMANASGRPGPRAVTGDYRRRITLELGALAGSPAAIVATNHDAARRLELGFVGVDSLGRHYDQPPFPHFGPALDDIVESFTAAVVAAAVR
jgi:hypothetical protein